MKKDKNTQKKLIGNAMIWASIMLAVALLTRDLEKSQSFMILLLMVVGWFLSQTLVEGTKDIQGAECSQLRRLFRFTNIFPGR